MISTLTSPSPPSFRGKLKYPLPNSTLHLTNFSCPLHISLLKFPFRSPRRQSLPVPISHWIQRRPHGHWHPPSATSCLCGTSAPCRSPAWSPGASQGCWRMSPSGGCPHLSSALTCWHWHCPLPLLLLPFTAKWQHAGPSPGQPPSGPLGLAVHRGPLSF